MFTIKGCQKLPCCAEGLKCVASNSFNQKVKDSTWNKKLTQLLGMTDTLEFYKIIKICQKLPGSIIASQSVIKCDRWSQSGFWILLSLMRIVDSCHIKSLILV